MTRRTSDSKDRMIHIRLDEKTHKRLKIEAVKKDSSIQQLVEGLILRKFPKSKSPDTNLG